MPFPRPSLRSSPPTPTPSPRATRALAKKPSKGDAPPSVDYGRGWFKATRDAASNISGSRAREEMERRRAANRAANNGLERKDLYTDAWAGSEWRGSKVNILTVLIAISVLTPAIGLAFALWSYGIYWG